MSFLIKWACITVYHHHSALDVLRRCALQIYILLTYLLTYLLTMKRMSFIFDDCVIHNQSVLLLVGSLGYENTVNDVKMG